ncbi:hypothetical protein Pmani_001899 [Petrolisthes manimaculis]|uniref:Uncharacterized protein n=1 Tax=Petrolisthes manimaculis TaxID=1843537 RepID=A0AAE1QJK6_9EUCA|nr:hypothetical protein Pmani_001899 [Petrolisthes manimaculis]
MWRDYRCTVPVLVVLVAVQVVVGEASVNNPRLSDVSRLQEVQREFLDVVGNSSSSVKNLGEVMTLLHSATGRHLGRLLMEGVMLGAQEKESGAILSQFLVDLQERLPPRLLKQMDNYRDFFKGMDLSTLPLVWEQMFQKDELGNSLAAMPLGQLVDMLQPISSKYGIDIRAFVNSLVGKGDNNARDLLLDALHNLNWTSIFSSFLNNSSSTPSAMQTTESDPKSTTKTNAKKDQSKNAKNDKTLRLFRPLVASLLRENNIDLDADAVLEVVSPLLNGDLIGQAAPLLAALSSQGGGVAGIMPLIVNAIGGLEGQQTQKQMGGLLGGLGALLAGGKENMDLGSLIKVASMFVDNDSKPTKKSRNDEKVKKDGLDMGSLLNLAGQFAESNNINIGSMLEATSSFFNAEKKQKPVAKKDSTAPVAKDTETPSSRVTKKKKVSKGGRPRHFIDIIEPIVLIMQNDKKCNRKIKQAINYGKVMLMSNMPSRADSGLILTHLVSTLLSKEFLASHGLDVNVVVKTLKNTVKHFSWSDLIENLENDDYRESLIKTITPHATELAILSTTKAAQDKFNKVAVPGIQNLFASSGISGVTLDNFPERVAPTVGLLGVGWNLPFNPTTVLVPARDYVKDMMDWIKAVLKHIITLKRRQVEVEVESILKEACQAVLTAVKATRNMKVECLQQRLCHLTKDMTPVGKAITRTVSLVVAVNPVLDTRDSALLVNIVQALSGYSEDCEDNLSEDCKMEEDEEDETAMNLDYEHQEL